MTTSRLLRLPSFGVAVLRLEIALLALLASLVLPAYGVVLIDAATPTTLYATLNDQELYKSTDGGTMWTELDDGSDSLAVWRLFLAPQTPTTLYAIAGQGRKQDLLKSSDEGLSWTPLLHGTDEIPLLTVAINPQTLAVLYAGTNGSGVLKSSDGGSTWTTLMNDVPRRQVKEKTTESKGWRGYDWPPLPPITPPLPHHTILALVIDPLTPTTLYAGTNGGVWKSIDGGLTWTAMNSGFHPSTPDAKNFYSPIAHLALDPQIPTTLYASVNFDGGGIVRSTDGGVTWTSPQRGWPAGYGIEALALDPKTPATLYVAVDMAGLFKSTDGGQHWTALNKGLPLYFEARGGN